MGFLKTLFGGKEIKSPQPVLKQAMEVQSNTKRTIFEFFQIDLKSIPDDTFIPGSKELNTSGEECQTFRKTLPYKECGIFDTVEVIVIGESKNVNVFFKSFQPSNVKMDIIRKLIDELYLIYGIDSMDKGKFTDEDIENYHSNDFYMLFGRSWTDYPKHQHPVSIGRDEGDITLSIWGVNKEIKTSQDASPMVKEMPKDNSIEQPFAFPDLQNLTLETVEHWTQDYATNFRKEAKKQGLFFHSSLNNAIILKSHGENSDEYSSLSPEIIEDWSQVYAEAFMTKAKNIGISFEKEIYTAIQKRILGDKWLGPEKYKAMRQAEEAQWEKERTYTDTFNAKAIECAKMISVERKPIADVLKKVEENYFTIKELFKETFNEQLGNFDYYHVVFNESIRQIIEQARLSEEQKKEILSLRRKTSTAITKGNISNKEVPFDRIYELTK
ncbi:MAG: hypothetical protein ABI763_01060 [Bacteroidota bacterium]